MTTIALVNFSGYGHTRKVSEHFLDHVKKAGADVFDLELPDNGEVTNEQWAALEEADAIVYASPTYMGGPAWQFKKFADASSKPWFEQKWKDKVAGGITNSASTVGDKGEVIGYFFTLSQQHGQIWVGTGQMPSNDKASDPSDMNWTGAFAGAMTISRSDASVEESPNAGDLKSVAAYAARIVEITRRLKKQD